VSDNDDKNSTHGIATDEPKISEGHKASDNGRPTDKTRNGAGQFDWIKERSSCSLPKVFSTLREQIEQDVNTRNSLRPKTAPYEFSVKVDINEITVSLEAPEVRSSVIFNLGDHAIAVRDNQGTRMFDVTVSFDDAGRCRLQVNGQEREFWQVRRMALEDLMFRGL
jgi:hypothetical protein